MGFGDIVSCILVIFKVVKYLKYKCIETRFLFFIFLILPEMLLIWLNTLNSECDVIFQKGPALCFVHPLTGQVIMFNLPLEHPRGHCCLVFFTNVRAQVWRRSASAFISPISTHGYKRDCLLVCFLLSCSSWTQANISSMLAPQADRVMVLGEWETRWQEGRIGFHQLQVHK